MTTPSKSRATVEYLPGKDHWGDDIRKYEGVPVSQCVSLCTEQATCEGFVFDTTTRNSTTCRLKTKSEARQDNPTLAVVRLSGEITKSSTKLPTTMDALTRLAVKTFLGRDATATDLASGSLSYGASVSYMTNYQLWETAIVPWVTSLEEFKRKYVQPEYSVTLTNPIPTIVDKAAPPEVQKEQKEAPPPEVKPEDKGEEEEDTGTSVWVWVGIAIAVIVVIAVIIGAFVFMRRGQGDTGYGGGYEGGYDAGYGGGYQ